ncbi:hypothetical protein [Steroidobacter sp.]|uniref:hypothetical protein n=1 Tax=Steroidobacter sp. TaxID=1978227 RepID=UPI001A5AE9E7|nr:hypothetical protein [Steroidobacter sp.]MBL8270984.1 hypothetical protein [Steroidobacter sp.]
MVIGHPPQWIAEQHSHSAITMFTSDAAWVRGAQPHDVESVRRAMNSKATTTISSPTDEFGSEFFTAARRMKH